MTTQPIDGFQKIIQSIKLPFSNLSRSGMDRRLDPQPRQNLRVLFRGVQLKSATLKIRIVPGKTIWFTVLLFILLTAVGEWVARSESFQVLLTPPTAVSKMKSSTVN